MVIFVFVPTLVRGNDEEVISKVIVTCLDLLNDTIVIVLCPECNNEKEKKNFIEEHLNKMILKVQAIEEKEPAQADQVKQNKLERAKVICNAVMKGDMDTYFELAKRYMKNKGREDKIIAIIWLKAAGSKGHVGAQYMLGRIYLGKSDNIRVLPWKAEAVKWLHKAGTNGHAGAQFLLGEYYNSQGYMDHAYKWYRKAGKQDHVEAQFEMAMRHHRDGEYGLHFNQFYPTRATWRHDREALKWMRRAAANGYEEAQYILGTIYCTGPEMPGNLVNVDFVAAKKWFAEAARQGHGRATDVLSRIKQYGRSACYRTPEQVKRDRQRQRRLETSKLIKEISGRWWINGFVTATEFRRLGAMGTNDPKNYTFEIMEVYQFIVITKLSDDHLNWVHQYRLHDGTRYEYSYQASLLWMDGGTSKLALKLQKWPQGHKIDDLPGGVALTRDRDHMIFKYLESDYSLRRILRGYRGG